MTHDMNESTESPAQRVECLPVPELQAAMVAVVVSIIELRDTRGVPDVLNAAGLLARFEVYDCDQKWSDLEDAVKALAEAV